MRSEYDGRTSGNDPPLAAMLADARINTRKNMLGKKSLRCRLSLLLKSA